MFWLLRCRFKLTLSDCIFFLKDFLFSFFLQKIMYLFSDYCWAAGLGSLKWLHLIELRRIILFILII